jgi:hypothetical protein
LNIAHVDDPYQTLSKHVVDYHNDVPDQDKDTRHVKIVMKNNGKPNTGYNGTNNRWSVSTRDYCYTSSKKRLNSNTKKIISIYENNKKVLYLGSVQSGKKRDDLRLTSKKRFLSNSSLIGVQHNTKELTRIMNRSNQDHCRPVPDFSKTTKRNPNARPKTSQNLTRKFNGPKKSQPFRRPMTQSQNSTTVDQNLNQSSIFDDAKRKTMPAYSFNPQKRCRSTMPNVKVRASMPPERSYKQLRNKIISKMKKTEEGKNKFALFFSLIYDIFLR